jgi:hypothetical protein
MSNGYKVTGTDRILCTKFIESTKSMKKQKHVYFFALPNRAKFVHKGEIYTKLKDERAKDEKGKLWTFEPHYGCLISERQFKKFKLSKKDIRPL